MTDPSLDLFERLADGRCLVISEVGLAHDGDLDVAHSFIDLIADAGCDAVKFQTHIAAAESTAREPWRVRFSSVDDSRYDYWERTSFDDAGWKELKAHADERGLCFLSSPFSVEAAEMLLGLGVKAWKVASGEVTDVPLISFMASTGLPTIVSTGLASSAELDRAVETLEAGGCRVGLLRCTSEYPCPPENVGLAGMAALRERYGSPVGLSDHSGDIYAGLAATALGAEFLEVHAKLTEDMAGPDSSASLAPDRLSELVTGVRAIAAMRGPAPSQDEVALQAADMRRLFTKSIVAARPLKAGEVLDHDDVAVKKPGDGLSPERLDDVVGKTLKTDVDKDEPIRIEDLS